MGALIPLLFMYLYQNPDIPLWPCSCTIVLIPHNCHIPFQKEYPSKISLIYSTAWELDYFLVYHIKCSQVSPRCQNLMLPRWWWIPPTHYCF